MKMTVEQFAKESGATPAIVTAWISRGLLPTIPGRQGPLIDLKRLVEADTP